MNPPLLLTVPEACERLRIRRTTFDALVAAGKLPVHRVGNGRGRIFVAEADLVAYLDRCRVKIAGG